MSLFSIADKLASLDLSPIHLEAGQCLHDINPRSTCEQCVRACPTQALSLDTSVALKLEACVLCGQCLHECPVGALKGPDRTAEVWALASRAGACSVVELACAAHLSPEVGPDSSDTVLKIGSCLAALGPSAYIGLWALGIERIVVRLDTCDRCSIGTMKAAIEQTLATTDQLLAERSEADRILIIHTGPDRHWKRRPVISKKSGLSRRELFRRFAPGTRSQPESKSERFDAPLHDDHPYTKQVSLERRRFLNALRRLPPAAGTALSATPIEADSFARMTVSESCTACGACARICPTGALSLNEPGDNRYQLMFSAGECINCGLCLKACAPEALCREKPTLADLLETAPVTLRAGDLKPCMRCGVRFAGTRDSTLCPVCDFRHQHPLGSRLPVGLAAHKKAGSTGCA